MVYGTLVLQLLSVTVACDETCYHVQHAKNPRPKIVDTIGVQDNPEQILWSQTTKASTRLSLTGQRMTEAI